MSKEFLPEVTGAEYDLSSEEKTKRCTSKSH